MQGSVAGVFGLHCEERVHILIDHHQKGAAMSQRRASWQWLALIINSYF